MAAEFDESDFVDTDFQSARKSLAAPPAGVAADPAIRPPTREELDSRVRDTQARLEELKRAQDTLERERATLEEAKRRRAEYHTGREEMVEHLTRGIGLLEESELTARRDAELLGRTLSDLREHLQQVQSLNDQSWTQEDYAVELTRALTTIENARLEWNSAQLKCPSLSANSASAARPAEPASGLVQLDALGFGRLCRLGLAITWPLALVALAAVVLFSIFLRGR